VDLKSDANHCGSCTAPACSGSCQTGICCNQGETNCGGTCVDLTSDDKHCGACSGTNTDCSLIEGTQLHCRGGQCRFVDGHVCDSDTRCLSGKCDIFYADYDNDNYPSHYDTARFCTIPGVLQNGPYTTVYATARADGKWDCCDRSPMVHPGTTSFAVWSNVTTTDQQCSASWGDANCDGIVEVDPSAIITTGCTVLANSDCEHMTRVPTAADCGRALCGCGAPAAGGECSPYCAPGDQGVTCR
jgi:hypothetical protein